MNTKIQNDFSYTSFVLNDWQVWFPWWVCECVQWLDSTLGVGAVFSHGFQTENICWMASVLALLCMPWSKNQNSLPCGECKQLKNSRKEFDILRRKQVCSWFPSLNELFFLNTSLCVCIHGSPNLNKLCRVILSAYFMTGKPLLIFLQPWLISPGVSFLYCESKHFYIPASIYFISRKSILNSMKFPWFY